MSGVAPEEICLALMRSDRQEEVIDALTAAGYWEDPSVWRYYGDFENNFSEIGNQQSEAVAALIEKIVNGVDARLMNACWEQGIDPVSTAAPVSVREAVARFFDSDVDPGSERAGRISFWSPQRATAEGRLLTVSATGNMPAAGRPSITIADQGEGQTPDDFPTTFLSLQKTNKFYVHFVQGKFNMGGTGALQFCGGRHKLQLIVSRRNPALLSAGASQRDQEWGFTIARRESPPEGGRSSVFTYLAPANVEEARRGRVLSFAAESWPIFPEADGEVRHAYHRLSPYGSLLKLFEYEWQGVKSNIVSSGAGLLRRIDSGLPELALPVRVFECRSGYRGHSGSFATNALGIAARLEQDKAENLEPGFPIGSVVDLAGRRVRIRVFAFKKDKAANYRSARQGIIFTVNGQSHATISIDFFRRKDVGMSYLAESLLVLVDCSDIKGETREDLFMNSRDRLRDNTLSRRLESEIRSFLKDEPTLRALRNRRREEELSDKLADSRPLASVLEDLLQHSPSLARLLLQGVKLPSPFPPAAGMGPGQSGEFHGKSYPTFFRFRGLASGDTLVRDCHLDSKVRVAFETDAADDYFLRELDPGSAHLRLDNGTELTDVEDWALRGPVTGSASLSLEIPVDASPGQILAYQVEVTDPSRVEPFVNRLILRVRGSVERRSGTSGMRTASTEGLGGRGGRSQLALPRIVEVEETDWASHTPPFDEETALVVRHAGRAEDDRTEVYDFYVNVDNKYLRLAQKESADEPRLLRARFVYGLVLIGLALLQSNGSAVSGNDGDRDDGSRDRNLERDVSWLTRTIAPVFLPLIEGMGSLALPDD